MWLAGILQSHFNESSPLSVSSSTIPHSVDNDHLWIVIRHTLAGPGVKHCWPTTFAAITELMVFHHGVILPRVTFGSWLIPGCVWLLPGSWLRLVAFWLLPGCLLVTPWLRLVTGYLCGVPIHQDNTWSHHSKGSHDDDVRQCVRRRTRLVTSGNIWYTVSQTYRSRTIRPRRRRTLHTLHIP